MARLLDIFRRPDPNEVDYGPSPEEFEDLEREAIEWATRLGKQLDEREPRIRLLRDYYAGDQPLRYATKKWRETFGDEFGEISNNWCSLVVDAAIERMHVQGFRVSPTSAEYDERAAEIWQNNRLDLESDTAHTESLVAAYSYLLVWPDAEDNAVVTVEDPLQTIVELDPENRRRRIAAIKRWRGIDKTWHCLVFTPDWVWRLEGTKGSRPRWATAKSPEPNPFGVVPIIPMVNQPDVYGRGHSDLEDVVPLQDAVNKLLGDMMVASEFAAYRQRVLLGAEIPTDPETGRPDHSIVSGVNRWLAIESGDGEHPPTIQELSAADLSNYTKVIEQIVQHIAALTRTPPQYLLGQMTNVSGDALKAAESGLVSRVKRRLKLFGEAWEEAIKLAFLIEGVEISSSIETIWTDPETISEGARVDALQKMSTLGVPQVILWERWGMSQQEIKRARRLRAEEAAVGALGLGVTPNGAAAEIDEEESEDQAT